MFSPGMTTVRGARSRAGLTHPQLRTLTRATRLEQTTPSMLLDRPTIAITRTTRGPRTMSTHSRSPDAARIRKYESRRLQELFALWFTCSIAGTAMVAQTEPARAHAA